MTETAIIQGCLENNPVAQEALYRLYSGKMMGVSYRYAGNSADAEDILQESFIKVFAQMRQYSGKGSLEGWIRTIVVHTGINYLKKHQHFREWTEVLPMANALAQPEEVTGAIGNREIIECIRMLPAGYRTVLNLYAIEGYSHREIGQLLDIEESTSRSQYMRAKIMLEKKLVEKNILPAAQVQQRS